jgi:riboflavin synthase
MFTGLIEAVGRVVEIAPIPSGFSLRVEAPISGDLRKGESIAVNGVCLLERAMPAQGRFGGHLVLGHVDATGTIQAIRPDADFSWMTIGYPSSLAPYLIRRGSVAVDGISLTIAKLDPGTFDVQIVPFTWAQTHLGSLREGDRVNLECDMVGKYVIRAIETMGTNV